MSRVQSAKVTCFRYVFVVIGGLTIMAVFEVLARPKWEGQGLKPQLQHLESNILMRIASTAKTFATTQPSSVKGSAE